MNHYEIYPKGDFPIYLAYGFRPIFLLLAPYIVFSIILWSFVFAGYISLPINNLLEWHIYEMIFGVGSAMIVAFFLTGLPELFHGVIPIVGRKLAYIVILWVLGRVGFWFIDFVTVYIVGFLNISLLVYISYLATIPAFKDPNKKHISLVFSMASIVIVQIVYFLSVAGIVNISSYKILLLSLGLFLVLILLALRRISMESINELLEKQQIDEIFLAKSYRYNLAIFCIILYSFIEFFYPNNSTLAYICFACTASILALLNDFVLKDNNILLKPFVLYIVSTIVMTAVGFLFLGFNYLFELNVLNHFRHFLTTGTFGMVFYVVMIIVSTIHTGRTIFTNWALTLGLILIILATFIRAFIPYYYEYMILAYIVSSILWAIPFIIYMKIFFPFLLSARADGIKG
ncbi:NnrS family protein [Aliarcobacter vitoriensis]|uniref:Nitrite reductase n=1 Tax=Aliarcobacter vitoriensis TaxID=2011099 RepID=A0A366MV19_9BACT|nr:NnrS family protein [Aliarcobacter vitoriensis]RBQ29713.1 nitrite reductase [Aliarcobacter vitoriensis]